VACTDVDRKHSPALLIKLIELLAAEGAVSLFYWYALRRSTEVVDGRACS
jgi:hypothetical protein